MCPCSSQTTSSLFSLSSVSVLFCADCDFVFFATCFDISVGRVSVDRISVDGVSVVVVADSGSLLRFRVFFETVDEDELVGFNEDVAFKDELEDEGALESVSVCVCVSSVVDAAVVSKVFFSDGIGSFEWSIFSSLYSASDSEPDPDP